MTREAFFTETALERKVITAMRRVSLDDQARVLTLCQALAAGRITTAQAAEAVRLGPSAVRELADHVASTEPARPRSAA